MIYKLKSKRPGSPYAPSWDISLGSYQWEDSEKIKTIKEFLLSKEEEILKLEVNRDAGTGLGEESVTTRYGRYNVFGLGEECPEINNLFKFIQKSYLEFIKEDDTMLLPLKIVCWYNIIRKGQEIKEHSHGAGEIIYLSGNMHLDNYDSVTRYVERGMDCCMPNIAGGLTIFPSYVSHSVAEWQNDYPRLSLAFDLYIDIQPYYPSADEDGHPITFMNFDILNQLADPRN